MADLDPLLERNRHVATTSAREGTSISAKHKGLRDHHPSGGVRMSTPLLLPTRERS